MKVLLFLALCVAAASAASTGRHSRALLPPHLLAIVQQVAADPQFIALARASDSYKCMVAAGVTPTLNWLLEQGAAAILTNSAVKNCVEQGGGLINIISHSPAVQYAHQQAIQHGVIDDMREVVLAAFGPQMGGQIIAALQANRPSRMSSAKSLLPPHLLAIVQQVAADPQFIALARASDSYKCMVAAGITPTLNWLLQEGAAAILTNSAVKNCVEQGGGLINIISDSPAVQYAHQQAIQHGVIDDMREVVLAAFGPQLGGQIVAALQANRPSRRASAKSLLPPHLLAIVQQVAADPQFIALARASDSYKCMVAAGVTPTLNWLLEQGAAAVLTNSAVKNCVEQGGGLINIISSSPAVHYAHQQAIEHGVVDDIREIILIAFGPQMGGQIVAVLETNRP